MNDDSPDTRASFNKPNGALPEVPDPSSPTPPTRPPEPPPPPPEGADARKITEVYCSSCHDMKLVTSQRLDRATWEWVMDDMVGEYGATWITEEEQGIIIDYLTETYGRSRK